MSIISHKLRMAGHIRKASEILGSRIIAKTMGSKANFRKVAVTQNVNEIKGLNDDDSASCQSMIDRLMEKMDHLTTIVNRLSRDSASTKKALSEGNFRLMPWESDISSAQQRIFFLEWKLEALQKGLNRNNIIISGLDVDKTNIKQSVHKFLEDTFHRSVIIRKAIFLHRDENCSLIKVCLTNMEDKNRIIANRQILKGTGIYVNSAETIYERDLRRQLKLIAKDETEKGRTVFVGYRKLTVDGVQYIWRHGQGLVKKQNNN